jgi:DNA-binding transcriptional MocR family regulator
MPANTLPSNDSAIGATADQGMVPGPAITPAFSPLYQQIKALILQSLQSGEWKPSTAIPSEQELAGRYRVSQGTVRKAIDELAAENLVVPMPNATPSTGFCDWYPRAASKPMKVPPSAASLTANAPVQRRMSRARCRSGREMRYFKCGGCCHLPAHPPFWKIYGSPAVLSKG